jgi:hypothetical protein
VVSYGLFLLSETSSRFVPLEPWGLLTYIVVYLAWGRKNFEIMHLRMAYLEDDAHAGLLRECESHEKFRLMGC